MFSYEYIDWYIRLQFNFNDSFWFISKNSLRILRKRIWNSTQNINILSRLNKKCIKPLFFFLNHISFLNHEISQLFYSSTLSSSFIFYCTHIQKRMNYKVFSNFFFLKYSVNHICQPIFPQNYGFTLCQKRNKKHKNNQL